MNPRLPSSHILRTAFVVAASCLAFAQASSALGQVESLFDGVSLSGWEGDAKHWRVESGAIVGEIPAGTTLPHNTWLVWRGGELVDFDLQLQFRLTGAPAANSGIQFRCQVESVEHVSGYQADLDQGTTWLGRIYDEHGRELLVERGTRVEILADGQRRFETRAPADQYAVLFRDNDWNDYRVVAVGDQIAIYVNGTLFSELRDSQTSERERSGRLALQLHSGPETRVAFRNIRLEKLEAGDTRLKSFQITAPQSSDEAAVGLVPHDRDGRPLNLGFESGTLGDWTATGNAFDGQPVRDDRISRRWPGQSSSKQGDFFIGGYEVVQDRGTGTLTSAPFVAAHPYASYLIGGGESPATRVEIVVLAQDGRAEDVIASARGRNREQMQRVAVDLRNVQGRRIVIRLVDEGTGGWGHLNFDDFRLHDRPPAAAHAATAWRSTFTPLLNHLLPNQTNADSPPGMDTIASMFVPPGFSVDLIAAEPDLHQPIAHTFDARGRLWVVEAHSYPQKRADGDGLDRIVILADNDHDGTFESRSVFVEKLNLVSGLEIGFGGVWVGAAPQLLFIPDRNGDDRPDSEPQVLLDGFGFADTHETLNSFLWGPDGWLYGNQGVFNASKIGKPGKPDDQRVPLSAGVWRYHPTEHRFEVFAHGGSNQWGLDYDQHGQLFMTYCRSYWGQGDVTHVMQGAHYWNQVNSGYEPFISATAIAGRPWMKNYLLASARYGHGEGGSGKPGADAVYGGHSHVGTMIYLGDNWPPEYRNHLFTHNLHGHQINHVENRREAGGYNSVHAGYDVLFCSDQKYVAVDLQCGPDGAVYFSDWTDQRHCHNPDAEQWDRSNGRIYRMKFAATWRPVPVDYTAATDEQLAETQQHANDWHARAARLVLSERATTRGISPTAVEHLRALAETAPTPVQQLRGLWALHVTSRLTHADLQRAMADPSEYVRAWGVRLATEQPDRADTELAERLVELAQQDPSLFVRRHLASAIQRTDAETAWNLAEAICRHADTVADRDLPLLVWHGLAPLALADAERAFRLADAAQLPAMADYIHWYLAANSENGRAHLAHLIAGSRGESQLGLLQLMELAVRDLRHVAAPAAWSSVASSLYSAENPQAVMLSESIGAAFSDPEVFARLRQQIASGLLRGDALRRALRLLASDASGENLALYLNVLDLPEVTRQVIPLLSRFEDRAIADALLERLARWPDAEYSAAMEVLCARVEWAHMLLDQISRGTIPKSKLTAFYARQMASLQDAALRERLEHEWGRLASSSAERRAEIGALVRAYEAAPLWAYSAAAGAAHFKKLCAQCHLPQGHPQESSGVLAPSLTGARGKGVAYLVENVVDPNAVIGRDYQARLIQTTDGRVITGLVEKETESSLTVRTPTESVTIPKESIEEVTVSDNSFMPEGLLATLNERERLELFLFLMGQ